MQIPITSYDRMMSTSARMSLKITSNNEWARKIIWSSNDLGVTFKVSELLKKFYQKALSTVLTQQVLIEMASLVHLSNYFL